MTRKKIFIYLSFVVSAITFLTSTGRAQGRIKVMDPQAQGGTARAAEASKTQSQRHTGALSLPKGYGFDEKQIDQAIALSLKEQAQQKAKALNLAKKPQLDTGRIFRQQSDGFDKTQIDQAIARSLEAQAQGGTAAFSQQKSDGSDEKKIKYTGAAAQKSASWEAPSAKQSSASSPIQTWEDFPGFPEYLKYKMKQINDNMKQISAEELTSDEMGLVVRAKLIGQDQAEASYKGGDLSLEDIQKVQRVAIRGALMAYWKQMRGEPLDHLKEEWWFAGIQNMLASKR